MVDHIYVQHLEGAGGGSPDVASPYCGAGRGQGDENPGSYQNGQANSGSGGGGSTAGVSRNGGTGGSVLSSLLTLPHK